MEQDLLDLKITKPQEDAVPDDSLDVKELLKVLSFVKNGKLNV
ncbi:MAG: hypothetical protein JWQ34_1832, partial [Mucilaginibacter sp.]|nr:hypothetical protein [Mucilaginibacter sp.]MDB5003607.1 hypothetical protein [Mucilaginibacter sp.]